VAEDDWSWELPRRAQPPDAVPPRPPVASRGPRRAAQNTQGNGNFRRSIGYTILGSFIPGVGLIAARRRLIGGFVLGVFLILVGGLLAWALTDPRGLIATAVDPRLLKAITLGLILLGLVWVIVIVASHLSLTRGPLRRSQRIGASLLVGVLSFVIAAPVAVGARYSYDQAGLVNTVFHHEGNSHSATRPSAQPTAKQDPWKNTPRVNILLLGGDAGPDRTGTRTDTVMVASIDTKTGDTTLISLPRNTARMPFPKNSPLHRYYPNGFTNGDGNNAEYFLNAMYDNVPNTVPKNILGKTDNLGADVLKLSVGEAIGLKIDYYVLIDLAGFKKLIDALGGITVNINTYVAIGGNTDLHIPPKTWLHPGPNQHLDGAKALWFARGRYGADDFQRMDRQRCVVNAIIQQANPANVLTRYEAIAKAGKEIVKTDIPQEALPAFVDLSLRAKQGDVRSLVFKHGVNGFLSPDPNFPLMRQQVKKAIDETVHSPKKKSSKPKKHSGSSQSSSSPTAQSVSATDACAWNPAIAREAEPPR
jgi:polyisoprenyl-teichoic acid--peptidoglycan teichoic acid transferase